MKTSQVAGALTASSLVVNTILIGRSADGGSDLYELAFVELKTPDANGKRLVLPSELFDPRKHQSPFDAGVAKLARLTESTPRGSGPNLNQGPDHNYRGTLLYVSFRRVIDARAGNKSRLVSCCNFIVWFPTHNDSKRSEFELKNGDRIRFIDIRTLDLSTVGRGDDTLVKLWLLREQRRADVKYRFHEEGGDAGLEVLNLCFDNDPLLIVEKR